MSFDNIIRRIPKGQILFAQFVIMAIFLFKIAFSISSKLFSIYRLYTDYEYVPWIRIFYDESKPKELLFYFSYSILFCIFILVIYFLAKSLKKRRPDIYSILESPVLDNAEKYFLILMFSMSVNLVLIFTNWFYGLLIWIVFNTFIIKEIVNDGYFRKSIIPKFGKWLNFYSNHLNKITKAIMIFNLVLVTGALLFYVLPMLSGRQFIFNEFIELSEKTILSNKEIVDNHTYIKDNLYYPKYKCIEDSVSFSESDDFSYDTHFKKWKETIESNQYHVDFIDKNKFSFSEQILNRTFDIHNNQVLNPVNAWLLGVPIDKTCALYGFLNAWLAKKWFEITGGITYSRWFQFAYSFYFIYFLSMFLACWYCFRNSVSAVSTYCMAVNLVLFHSYMGYFYIIIGQIPMNPIRHVFDMFVLVFMVMYFRNGGWFAQLGVIICCLLSVLNADHFGLFLVFATSVTYAARYVSSEKKTWRDIGAVLILIIGTLILLKISPTLAHPGAKYFLDGFFSMPSHYIKIMAVTGLYSLVFWVVLYKLITRDSTEKLYIVLWSAVYSYLLLFHYFWHGNIPNAVTALPIIALLMISFILLSMIDILKIDKKFVYNCLTLFIAIACVSGCLHFEKTRQRYLEIRDSHVSKTWNMPQARIYTSMPEEPIKEAVEFLNEYSSGRNIYLLSKYDFFLPILARKYNDMGFPNIPWFIIVEKDRQVVVDRINEVRPKFLFVDTDIDLDNQLWTMNNYFTLSNPGIYRENKYRLLRLLELKKIFDEVRNDYSLLKKGQLVSIYVRKNG